VAIAVAEAARDGEVVGVSVECAGGGDEVGASAEIIVAIEGGEVKVEGLEVVGAGGRGAETGEVEDDFLPGVAEAIGGAG
jgi:hypothetical protein